MRLFSLNLINKIKIQRGFAIFVVIWGLGLISLLLVSFMLNSRLRLQMANNVSKSIEASFIAEGVIHLLATKLLKKREESQEQMIVGNFDGRPNYCKFDGSFVVVNIFDEGGKIDINSASSQLLEIIMTMNNVDTAKARKIVNSIIDFRSIPDVAEKSSTPANTKPFLPKNNAFETILEIDQVEGIDSALFHSMLPFITVHSFQAGIDPFVAPPALFAALSRENDNLVQRLISQPFPNNLNRYDKRFPSQFKEEGKHNFFTIHIEVLLPTSQKISKEAIIDFQRKIGLQYSIKEMRGSDIFYLDNMKSDANEANSRVAECYQLPV